MWSRLQRSLLVGFILAGAVALRLSPLFWSPLPFNPDGILYAADANATLAATHLPLARLPTDSLLFTVFLAEVTAVTGQPALTITQPTMAIVGAIPLLIAIALGHRLARQGGVSWRPAFGAGLVAGALLAVEGLPLQYSMVVDEQVLGLVVVPLAAIAFNRALHSGDWRWFGLTWLLILALPPLHNLDGIIATLALTLVFCIAFARTLPANSHGIASTRGLLTVAVTWLYAFGYHPVLATHTPLRVIQSSRLSSAPGLLLAWLLVIALGTIWLANRGQRTIRLVALGVFASGFVLLGVNLGQPVFPGATRTPVVLFLTLVPLVVPAAAAAVGVPLATRTESDGPAVLALLGAPLVLIALTLTVALSPVYLDTAYRTQPFLHLPAVVLAGLGTLWLSTRPRLRHRKILQGAVVALVLVSAVATLPSILVLHTELAHSSTTTPAELQAAEFAAQHVPGAWASDHHLGMVAGYHTPRQGSQAQYLPVYTWLTEHGDPPACPTLAQRSWTTVGVPALPQQAPPRLAPAVYDQWAATGNVVYHGGTADSLILHRPHTPTPTC